MTISLETILYLYVFVSVSIIFFNIACVIVRKKEEKSLKKRSAYYTSIIQEHFQDKAVDSKHLLYWQKELRKVSHLTAFHEAVQHLLIEQEEKMYSYLKRYKEVFTYLIQIYMTKESVYKAYFAYLMSVYKVCEETDKNFITDNLLEMTKETSLYTRENAMKALLAFGNVENVVNALKGMERLGYTYHKKMLSDDLLEFNGNHEKLIERLLREFEVFSLSTKVGIVNYITYCSQEDKVVEFFNHLLLAEDTEKELKIAIIRYFGHHPNESVLKILLFYLKKEDVNFWEYAAVCASALKKYPEKSVKTALMDALSHPNWYVRKNAASSLAERKLTKQDIEKIREKKDKYAKEILIYEMEKQKEETENA